VLVRYPSLVLFASILCGCEDIELARSSSRTRVVTLPNFVANADDGEKFVGGPAQIVVLKGGAPEAQLSAVADSARGVTWSALVGTSVDDLLAGEVNGKLIRAPLDAGVGTVSITEGTEQVGAVSGTFEAKMLVAGEISGTARTDRNMSSATFSGRFAISCWVFPEDLGQAPSGRGDGTVTMRVEDVEFKSPFCQRVAHLR